jgi:hypothetical protein
MENVYFIGTGHHRDSMVLDRAGIDEDSIKRNVIWYENEYALRKVKDIKVDFENKKVFYKYQENWDNEWDDGVLELTIIPVG